MLNKEGLVQLEDQTLEGVSGGTGGAGKERSFSDDEYKRAGVIIKSDGYYVKYSTGAEENISKRVANSMVDCLYVSGKPLDDGELKALIALIAQCK